MALTYMEDVNHVTSECVDLLQSFLNSILGIEFTTEEENCIWGVIQEQLSNHCETGDYKNVN